MPPAPLVKLIIEPYQRCSPLWPRLHRHKPVYNATAQMLPTISLEPQVTHYLNDNYANSAVLNKTQYSAWVKVEMPIYEAAR